jgi:protein-tyrosine phosphatase
LWGVQADYLEAALEVIDEAHGGPERYLRRQIGLDHDRLEALAARYLQPE